MPTAIREDKAGIKERMAEGWFTFVAKKEGVPYVHGLSQEVINQFD